MRRNPVIAALLIGLLCVPVALAQDVANDDSSDLTRLQREVAEAKQEAQEARDAQEELRQELAKTRARLKEAEEAILEAELEANELLERKLGAAGVPEFRRGRWATSEDGSWLAHGSLTGHLTVWRTEDAEPVIRVKVWRRERVAALSFEAEGTVLRATIDDGRSVRVDLATGDVIERTPAF